MSLEAPVRPPRCKEADCDFPLGGRCTRLHANPADECEQLVRVRRAVVIPDGTDESLSPSENDNVVTVDDTTPPWTGQHVAYGQLGDLTFRAMPRLIGVVGPHNAGKTSLLASLFLQIANGQYGNLGYRFASSRTLLAFDRLVIRANEWSGKQDTDIVDHTPKMPERSSCTWAYARRVRGALSHGTLTCSSATLQGKQQRAGLQTRSAKRQPQ